MGDTVVQLFLVAFAIGFAVGGFGGAVIAALQGTINSLSNF